MVYADVSRWRQGDRDDSARAAHNAEITSWRRSLREAEFDVDDHEILFAQLRAGLRLSEAAAVVGQTTNGVYGRARWDPEFRDKLEQVLAETCRAEICGTASGARQGGHCAPCRAAHRSGRAT
ncbi:hypothetical protein BS329_38850 [Amycolatopsis coloradensis]|uniref:Uncharacterized protein n=2 Tax=Amycolatopsis coloradensis TaxID=76021 RepID=A0A1R0KEM5_9PSEU|nr:hypothetical protein BS329_38850 [Amycolatopsis coloradensis]